MNLSCEGENCHKIGWLRCGLFAAGLYHLAFGIWSFFWPLQIFNLFEIQHPNHPMMWRTIGLIAGGLGLAFIIASYRPVRHWLISLLGLVKVVLASTAVIIAVWDHDLHPFALALLIPNDLIWLPIFILVLYRALRAHAGIPESRSDPYSIEEATSLYTLSSGQSLAKASSEQALALVFLRHFGCTFTRQILRSLQQLESEADQNGARLVLVHMLQSGEEIGYFRDNMNILRIADPRCELYRAFGLGKGGFLELFGPHVWWRGAIALIKGCGVGHLAGDGLQMPGAFVLKNGRVTASQPAQTAADLPNLSSLFENPAL